MLTIRIGTLVAADEGVLEHLLGKTAPVELGALPAESELTAYHKEANGDRLFALHSTVVLPGTVPVTPSPGDVIRFDGSAYTIEFDASAAGLPEGVRTDAVSRGTDGVLLLSFDIGAELPTAGDPITVADEDIVSHDPNGSFTLALDGSASGIPIALDVDGVTHLGNGRFGLSFDGSGRLGAIDFNDEDVLALDPSGPTWAMLFDASEQDASWSDGPDLDAVAVTVPEPSRFALGLSAAATFVTLRNRRNRRA